MRRTAPQQQGNERRRAANKLSLTNDGALILIIILEC